MKTKKLWALLVAAVMVIGLLPTTAFAAAPTRATVTVAGQTISFSGGRGLYNDPYTASYTIPFSLATGSTAITITGDNAGTVTYDKGGKKATLSVSSGGSEVSTDTTPDSFTWNLSGSATGDWYDLWILQTGSPELVFSKVRITIGKSKFKLNVDGGQISSPVMQSGSEVLYDTSLEVAAFDNYDGYSFESWLDINSGDRVAVEDSTTFKMPERDLTLRAVYTKDGTDGRTKYYGVSKSTSPGSYTPSNPSDPSQTGTYTVDLDGDIEIYAIAGANVSYTDSASVNAGATVLARSRNTLDSYKWSSSYGSLNVPNGRYDRKTFEFTMPGQSFTLSLNGGEFEVKVGSATGGSAKVDESKVGGGEVVTATATPRSGYYFTGWSKTSGITYEKNYSASSNPTKFTVDEDATITPSFAYGYDYGYGYGTGYPSGYPTGYYPGTYIPGQTYNPGTAASTANSFGTGTAKATVTTSGVTAGYNASGSVNSANLVSAIQRYFRANTTARTVNVTIPTGATALSKSSAQKVINAAGTGKTVTLTGSASFGTVSYSLTQASNVYFQMSSSGTKYTNARNIIVRAYGNSDAKGFSMQSNSLGISGTFRIKPTSLGLSAGPGDTVYALFYNPTTNGFTRKTLVVNSAGEVAYATTRGGVHLFSETPFAR
jgi:hypothetical protein